MESSERSQSVWKADNPLLEFPPLGEDLQVDVCVVGAGIAGLTTAYLLAKEGKRVAVLDDNAVGGGETAQSSAHLSSAIDDRYQTLERIHGRDGARLAYESHDAAIERIGRIAEEEGIPCEFRRLDGYLFLSPDKTEDLLDRELEAAHRAGYTDVEKVQRIPVATFESGPALRFPRQGQFDPLRYVNGLARAAERLGVRLFTGTHVEEVTGGSPPSVRTSDGRTVTADAVVVATNSPVSDHLAIHTKQAPYRTFAIGVRVPAGAVPTVLLWDTLEMYHYVRLQHGDGGSDRTDVLIVGGEDHKTGQADDADERFARLEAWTRARFPVNEVTFRWSGQVMEPTDGLAFIGPDPSGAENVYVVTGDSGHGLTHGTIAGMVLADGIAGRPNPWAELYDASRKSFAAPAVKEFLLENVNVGAQYADWVRGGEASSADAIAPGSGAILRDGVQPVAAYRAPDGTLHRRSAVCPHLGCVVHWNSEETSWDCPCHGSRFAPTGEVLNGPSISGLPAAEG